MRGRESELRCRHAVQTQKAWLMVSPRFMGTKQHSSPIRTYQKVGDGQQGLSSSVQPVHICK
eukprot:scaffold114903_cov19-Tisochrysis_lutea.AAC.3